MPYTDKEMGNIIPYKLEETPESTTNQDTNKSSSASTSYLTVPSIPKPQDILLKKDSIDSHGSIPETMDLRPLVEKPYESKHPLYLKYNANVEIIARQLECMATNCSAWTGRISRQFWQKLSRKTLVSIRDIYECVLTHGILSESQEHRINDTAVKISARPYRLIIVKPLDRNISLWQTLLSSSCPIAISLALYTNHKHTNVYEIPENNENLYMVIPALIVGYDSKREIFIVQSPFTNEWGEDGYIALPYECIDSTSLVLEAWIAKFSKNLKRFKETRDFSSIHKQDFDTISIDVYSNNV